MERWSGFEFEKMTTKRIHLHVASCCDMLGCTPERVWPLRVVLRKRLFCVSILLSARHFEVDNLVVGENPSSEDWE